MSLTSALGHSIQPYHYIILGAGCAGLSLAVRLARHPHFAQQKILLIDKAPKSLNDRTWCFWEKQPGYFESIVHHSWPQLQVKHGAQALSLAMDGYSYKMIRGIDFYKHCFSIISQSPNIHILYDTVNEVDAEAAVVHTTVGSYSAAHIFSSVLLQQPASKPTDIYLLQHFRGWWLETETDVFDSASADFMNFRTSQQHGCAFMYVLPVNPRKALVEHTLFSEDTLASEAYDAALTTFLKDELHLANYEVTEVENGLIPMTNIRFAAQQGKVTFIGTAGGQTKPSTGFTFQNIQQHSEALVAGLALSETIQVKPVPARFSFYDTVLLRVLHEKKVSGAEVFFKLFQQNPASRIFRFLDNESSYFDEFCIMNSTPKRVFLPAALASF